MTGSQEANATPARAGSAFRDFLAEVPPIRLREPLAETLGALKEGTIIEYGYIDVVKLAGHACPTTAGAYLVCRKALEKLYPGEVPVRGEIAVTVYGEPDDGVYGVMSQVISLLTGAAPETGFRGLGHRFKRKDLLRFQPQKPDPQAMCFEFRRQDTGSAVLAKFRPQQVPFAAGKAARMSRLVQQVIWEAATGAEKQEFQDLWMGRVKDMLIDNAGINDWLTIEEKEELK